MPEDVETTEDAEFAAWLAEAAEDDEEEVTEAEEDAEREDEKALKVAMQTQKVVASFITEKKSEDMVDKFMAKAPETAKELFAIYRTGNEDPKQLKRIMDLAVTKAKEAVKSDEEVSEEVTKKAEQIASEQYGAGPISGGTGSPEPTPEQKAHNEWWETVNKTGDPKALLGLLAEDVPFIDSILTGKPLNK